MGDFKNQKLQGLFLAHLKSLHNPLVVVIFYSATGGVQHRVFRWSDRYIQLHAILPMRSKFLSRNESNGVKGECSDDKDSNDVNRDREEKKKKFSTFELRSDLWVTLKCQSERTVSSEECAHRLQIWVILVKGISQK